jgi:MtN3 and saliva related transmembrane protein
MVSSALGITAAAWAVVMALSPLLQVREIIRRGSSEGISVGYFGVLLVGFGLWVAYGVASCDLPLVVPNSVAFVVMGCTIWVAVRRPRRRRVNCVGARRGCGRAVR